MVVSMNSNMEDIEQENVGEVTPITNPFDPSKIDVDIATVNLGMVVEMLQNEEIDLHPSFQRSSDIWSPTQKSRLIESILLGLPLPSFYFSENPNNGKLEIIDGLQRLCAIKDFILNKQSPLALRDLQFLTEYNGKNFESLERPDKRRISSLKITMNTLRKRTPVNVKYVIFQRVNTAGEPLTAQEMRNALNQGVAADFIAKLAEDKNFKRATDYKLVGKNRMQDRDFANRFVAFYLMLKEYKGDLDYFLNEGMAYLNNSNPEELNSIEQAFARSMDVCYRIFRANTFRKILRNDERRHPISKAIFDAMSVNVAKLHNDEQEYLVQNRRAFVAKYKELCDDPSFNDAVSNWTGSIHSVTTRFNMVDKMINNFLNDNTL